MPLISTARQGRRPALRAAVGHCIAESPRSRPSPKEMTRSQTGRVKSVCAALPVSAVLLLLLGSTTVQAGPQPHRLRVESSTTGEIALDARTVTIDDTLHAIASEAGFDVLIEPGIQRPPVNMAVSMAPIEDVLRQILRGRNYALVYDADDASLSRVIVLRPPAMRRPVAFRRSTR